MTVLYTLNHVMPELGSPTAGCSQSFTSLDAALDELRWLAATHLESGQKLILTIENDDVPSA